MQIRGKIQLLNDYNYYVRAEIFSTSSNGYTQAARGKDPMPIENQFPFSSKRWTFHHTLLAYSRSFCRRQLLALLATATISCRALAFDGKSGK